MMSHNFKAKLLLLSALSALTLSCTRAEKETEAKISIALPQSMSSQKQGALAVDTLSHIVINVTGEGILTPIVFNWDLKQNGLGQTLAAPIELLIPQGTDRLIQVLAVYQDSTGNSMQFFYGDKVQTLANLSETVTIGISSVSQAAPVFTGKISGRYLTGTNTGPTGIVTTGYVASGRPPMIIRRDMMYSGWFSVMGIYGAKFSYTVIPLGSAPFLLFDGHSVDLSESSFPRSTILGRLTIPTSQKRNESNSWKVEGPRINIYGFWGVTSGLNVCAYSTPVTTQYAVGNSATPASQFLAADISGTVPSDFITNTALPAMYLQTATGTGNGSGACASVNEFTNAIKITPQISDNGNDGAAGFSGPFRMANSNIFAVSATDASTYTISSTVLPGVLDLVSGFLIYKKIGSAENLPETLDCSPESLNIQGFQSLTSSPLTAEAWTQALSISSADITNKVTLAICPVSKTTGLVFPIGVYIKSQSFNPTPASLVVTQISSSLSVAGDRGSVVVDSLHNLYYAAVNAYQIKKIAPDGTETVFAGSGTNSATDGSAGSAGFMQPTLLAIDSSDNLYVADGFYIRKITAGGTVTTMANLSSGDIRGLAADASGNVYFVNGIGADIHKVQKVTPGGTVSSLAGASTSGFLNGTGASAQFNLPHSLIVDSSGNVFVADTGNYLIRKISPGGVVTTFAGTVNAPGFSDGVGTAAKFSFWNLFTPMAIDAADNIYIGNMDGSTHNTIKKMKPDATVSTYCGVGSTSTTGTCSTGSIFSRFGLAIGSNGTIYFADSSVLQKITP